MTAPEPTLPPERVEELIRFLHNEGDGGIWEHFDRRNAETVAGALSPLIAGWLAEAENLYDLGVHHGTEAGYQAGAAEVRERVESVIDRGKRTVHGRLALAEDLRAVLATEREERR